MKHLIFTLFIIVLAATSGLLLAKKKNPLVDIAKIEAATLPPSETFYRLSPLSVPLDEKLSHDGVARQLEVGFVVKIKQADIFKVDDIRSQIQAAATKVIVDQKGRITPSLTEWISYEVKLVLAKHQIQCDTVLFYRVRAENP